MVPSLKFRCRQFSKYLLQPSSNVSNVPLDILIFCIVKSSLKTKNIGHITDENTFMMCPNFIYWILQVLKDSKVSKSLTNQELLACFLNSNCNSNSHTNHGVVTCADETHHLCAVGEGEGHRENHDMVKNPCHIRLFQSVYIVEFFSLSTSFSVLLNALYRVLGLSYMAFR